MLGPSYVFFIFSLKRQHFLTGGCQGHLKCFFCRKTAFLTGGCQGHRTCFFFIIYIFSLQSSDCTSSNPDQFLSRRYSPLVGQGLPIIDASRSQSDTPHFGRTPLYEWPARRRDLNQTTHNTHHWQISLPTVGFEPVILTSERPQTHAL